MWGPFYGSRFPPCRVPARPTQVPQPWQFSHQAWAMKEGCRQTKENKLQVHRAADARSCSNASPSCVPLASWSRPGVVIRNVRGRTFAADLLFCAAPRILTIWRGQMGWLTRGLDSTGNTVRGTLGAPSTRDHKVATALICAGLCTLPALGGPQPRFGTAFRAGGFMETQ